MNDFYFDFMQLDKDVRTKVNDYLPINAVLVDVKDAPPRVGNKTRRIEVVYKINGKLFRASLAKGMGSLKRRKAEAELFFKGEG